VPLTASDAIVAEGLDILEAALMSLAGVAKGARAASA